MVNPVPLVFYVDPNRGRDTNPGSSEQPFKTLTKALQQVRPGGTVQLAVGQYHAASGEQFPLQIPANVTVVGDEISWGQGILLQGGGLHSSSGFVPQNVAIVMGDQAELQGVTVSNPAANGTGIWIEAASPALAHNTFTQCGREGVFISGNASPAIADNIFTHNVRSGISFVRNGKGEIYRNTFRSTGYGIAIGEQAAPLITANRIVQNQTGILIWGQARPVLRQNIIQDNVNDGLVLLNEATVDLGQPQNPAANILRRNGNFDLHNSTANAVISVGNDLMPMRLQGQVDFVASEVRQFFATNPLPPNLPDPDPTIPDSNPATQFQDLIGHWSAPFVSGLVERGIIRGFLDGTFRPDAKLTRAQYAAILVTAFQPPPRLKAIEFQDVSPQFWAYRAIQQAYQMGFLAGFPDRTFRPDVNLSRVHALVSLVNGLQLTAGVPNSLQMYRDRAQIPPYATAAIATATERAIVVNYPQYDQLNPMRDITRGEMAALVYQALVSQGRAPVIASPYIVRPNTTQPLYADTSQHWAADFIHGLSNQQVMRGFVDGTFRPDLSMTRAEYAVLIANAFDLQPQRQAIDFTDVPDRFWAAAAIQTAYRAGFLSGFPNRTFAPAQTISRVQVWISLVSGLQLDPGDESLLSLYQDRMDVPEFARPHVASATRHQLIINRPDVQQLRPNHAATRAEVAAAVYQARVALQLAPAIASPYIVTPPRTNSTPAVPASPESQASSPQPSTPSFSPSQPASIPTAAPAAAPKVNSWQSDPASPNPDSKSDSESDSNLKQPPASASSTTANPQSVIILDPGHGGDDIGAISKTGLQEKSVVLDIAQRTAQQLQQQISVILTRDRDQTLSLSDRVQQIQQHIQQQNVIALISLHTNAISLNHPQINGLETYYYPGRQAAADLAAAIHQHILQQTSYRDRGIRQANYHILREINLPAIVVELGFITGADDAPKLARANHRQQLADAISQGVYRFLEQQHFASNSSSSAR